MQLFTQFQSGLPYAAFLKQYGSDGDRQRWQRVFDQVVLTPAQTELLGVFKREMNVLCLAGAWCGDCVGQCPIFERFVQAQPLIRVHYLDRDVHADVQRALQINAGNRVPVLVFFSEDGHEVARYGERTLARYRELMRLQTGEGCPTGIMASNDPTLAQVTQEWLNEFERVQWILRLSTRLRTKHND